MLKHTPELVLGNIFIRPNLLTQKGDVLDGHTHNFDHTTYVVKGSVHVKATDKAGTITEKDFTAGQMFLVLAETCHVISALEDNTEFHCIYSHRDPQGRVSVDYTGWGTAYALQYKERC